MDCKQCGCSIKKYAFKYCSNQCQRNFEYGVFVTDWKSGVVTGSVGLTAKNISGYLKRYLDEKYGFKCSLCGWDKVNSVTNRVPLEIDHINGDSEDNSEINLRVVCPNCHSLSSNYKNLNRGKGRVWRKDKYIKNPRTGARGE